MKILVRGLRVQQGPLSFVQMRTIKFWGEGIDLNLQLCINELVNADQFVHSAKMELLII